MPSSKELFESFWVTVVLKNFPDAKIKYKNESKLMKVIGTLLKPINPKFMTNYITTLGNTIYFPSAQWVEKNYGSALQVTCHEFIHIWDYAQQKRKYKMNMFAVRWLSPQIFAVFSVLALLSFVNLWFLMSLTFLLFLLPWPSSGRTRWESNGYAVTMLFSSVSQGIRYNAMEDADALAKQFTTSAYYWMCRDKEKVSSILMSKYGTLMNTHAGAKEVYEWLKNLLR